MLADDPQGTDVTSLAENTSETSSAGRSVSLVTASSNSPIPQKRPFVQKVGRTNTMSESLFRVVPAKNHGGHSDTGPEPPPPHKPTLTPLEPNSE